MTCKDIIKYFKEFGEDEARSIVIVNPDSREHFNIARLDLYAESPALLITVSGAEPLDEKGD